MRDGSRQLGKADRQRLIGSIVTRRRVGTQFELLDALATILAQFGRRATAASNIVVLQSELGSAPAIARALDRTDHPKVVGTLAGDDTCLVVAKDAKDAVALAR